MSAGWALLRMLARATELAPDRALGWLNLGVSLEEKNDRARAEAAYRAAICAEPDLAPPTATWPACSMPGVWSGSSDIPAN